ncbi:MAG: nucleotide exchange factor GrpE [Candidatus Sumerlaeia bacterium]|nr:nucleotide exchange factor GrpE [Candidatus Sumerlaeia bacterium]
MSIDPRRPTSRGRRIPVNDLDSPESVRSNASGQSLPEPEPDTAQSPAEKKTDQTSPTSPTDQMDVAALRARLAELEDRWKRAAADLENHRKQFNRQIEQLRRFDREAILRAWLDVVDDMERALCAQGASNNPWYEGMEAIHQRMLSVLAQFGVTPYVPQGEMFDPALHEAVATARLPGEPEGKIVEVVSTGYKLDGAVLRPAKVVAVKHSA